MRRFTLLLAAAEGPLRRGEHAYRRPGPDVPRPPAAQYEGTADGPLLGRAVRRRRLAAAGADGSGRPGVRLVALRPYGQLRAAVRNQGRVLDLGNATLGERRAEAEHRPDESGRPAALRTRR